MIKRKPCKFFAQGACLKGELCNFSHDPKHPYKNVPRICTFYQKGICSYGSRCKYQHVKSSWVEFTAGASSSSSSLPHQSVPSLSVPQKLGTARLAIVPAVSAETSKRCFAPSIRTLCSFDTTGSCPYGDKCSHIHCDLCTICRKNCLHPVRPEERGEHLNEKQKHIDALTCSQEIECCVCLDPVLSKPTAAERKFAVLPECDHPFCISCIRKWRNTSPTSGMASLRACPICRKPSHFVIPSLTWYSSKQEKQEIIDRYKAKLRSIDCKHFNFGNGNCPFGANCFYKHTVKPGSYTWKHNKPPPRKPPRDRTDVMDMDASYDAFANFLDALDAEDLYEDLFEHLVEDDEPDIYTFEDCYNEDVSPWDMALLFAHVDIDSNEFSSDEECFP